MDYTTKNTLTDIGLSIAVLGTLGAVIYYVYFQHPQLQEEITISSTRSEITDILPNQKYQPATIEPLLKD